MVVFNFLFFTLMEEGLHVVVNNLRYNSTLSKSNFVYYVIAKHDPKELQVSFLSSNMEVMFFITLLWIFANQQNEYPASLY